MAAAPSRETALAAVKAIFERYWLLVEKENYAGFDKRLMSEAVLLDASVGPPSTMTPPPDQQSAIPAPSIIASATFSLKITPAYCNLNNVMHGGAAGVIFDMMTTTALGPIARPGYWDFLGGVTRNLNISYLRAVPVGTIVHVHSHVYQVGRSMAYIKGWMFSEDGKTVYCTCDHHKVSVPSRKEHMELKVPWDEQFEQSREPAAPKL
ncbi:thioesterase family protein-like protein [Coniochaeta ligniaria NRRL 30616]|uniref:Thioesterase family protein-like protein n=1 Tax=Coniochaeta ligniaria NRRL 30616 TaxID=1408157 RepID=A0A1J7I6D0_9PEZI|nr:thioesterase family protein-like protein [Coniochaeta ligniaria NRRL 30616]